MLPIAPDTLLQQRYRILNILQDGELGRTYLATDRSRADTYCVLEEISLAAQSTTTVAAKASFKQEATLLYQLQHPQLPRFWTTFEEQNRLFLVRDYVEGKTYAEILAERRAVHTTFSEAEVWRFLLQILPVLGFIHSKSAIHRNISPAHIICRDGDNLPVPIDFGIGTDLANTLQARIANQPISTGQPGYAPAEQLQHGQVYPNSDLYALAVTAIVLLTGKEPSALFTGDRMNWDWRKWTPISDELATILGRMLNPAPSDRYQSAIEAYRDLQPLNIPDRPVPAATPPTVERLSAIPTVAIGEKIPPNRLQTAITHLNSKSIWEKPQVFIPLGLMISLLAGLGSWFGVSQLLHRQSTSDPSASDPPKQVDFNNPTIPTDANNPSATANDPIVPELDRSIVKEGTVDAANPVRYRISAVAGQNLDIQLVPSASQSTDSTNGGLSSNPTGTKSANPIATISPSPTPSPSSSTSGKFNNPPISMPSLAATQVLMSILAPTGTPIDSQADRVVGWRGQVPSTGEYTIELSPIKGLSGSAFPYKLSVTQVSVSPSPTPSVENVTPSTGSTPPLVIPAPLGGNGINSTPSGTKSTSPSNNSVPSASPVPIVIPSTSSPTQSEQPKRSRRNQTERSTEESTPTRRRRSQVESSEESTPTRRRRNRQNDTENQPTQNSSPSPEPSTNSPSNTPTPEPSVGIPVPPAKSTTSPAGSDTVDTD